MQRQSTPLNIQHQPLAPSCFTTQQSIESVLSEDSASGGNAVAQIMYDAAMQRFGTPHVGVGLMAVIIVGVFFCNVATMTYVSR